MTADARANVRAQVAGQVSESTVKLVLIEDTMRLRAVDPRPPCILCDQPESLVAVSICSQIIVVISAAIY